MKIKENMKDIRNVQLDIEEHDVHLFSLINKIDLITPER